jgi:hypothetical protein
MDQNREINLLAGEAIAMQWILTQVLSRLCQVHPTIRDAITLGFDDAANGINEAISRSGKGPAPDHVVQAARTLRDLRAATLGNEPQAAV